MQITNFEVTFGRTIKPGEYESKPVVVKLSGMIAEEDTVEKVLEHAGNLAYQATMQLLYRPDAWPEAGGAETRAPRTRKSVTIGGPESGKVEGETAVDPAAIGGQAVPPTSAGGETQDLAAIGVSGGSVSSQLPASAATPVSELGLISDEAFIDAVTHKASQLDPAGIAEMTKLIASFLTVPVPPGRARDIPAAQRPTFLAGLAALGNKDPAALV